MAENIFAGLMGLAVIAAGIWGWNTADQKKRINRNRKKSDNRT